MCVALSWLFLVLACALFVFAYVLLVLYAALDGPARFLCAFAAILSLALGVLLVYSAGPV